MVFKIKLTLLEDEHKYNTKLGGSQFAKLEYALFLLSFETQQLIPFFTWFLFISNIHMRKCIVATKLLQEGSQHQLEITNCFQIFLLNEFRLQGDTNNVCWSLSNSYSWVTGNFFFLSLSFFTFFSVVISFDCCLILIQPGASSQSTKFPLNGYTLNCGEPWGLHHRQDFSLHRFLQRIHSWFKGGLDAEISVQTHTGNDTDYLAACVR